MGDLTVTFNNDIQYCIFEDPAIDFAIWFVAGGLLELLKMRYSDFFEKQDVDYKSKIIEHDMKVVMKTYDTGMKYFAQVG